MTNFIAHARALVRTKLTGKDRLLHKFVCDSPEEVGHASCHVISLAYARSLDSDTFIHQDSLLATFVLWSTYNRHGIVQTIDRTADLKQ